MDNQDKQTALYIANKIKKLRKEKELTQEELGKQLNLSRSQIQRYERGENEVPSSLLPHIAKLFNRSPNVFYPASKEELKLDTAKSKVLKELLKSIKNEVEQAIDILE